MRFWRNENQIGQTIRTTISKHTSGRVGEAGEGTESDACQ